MSKNKEDDYFPTCLFPPGLRVTGPHMGQNWNTWRKRTLTQENRQTPQQSGLVREPFFFPHPYYNGTALFKDPPHKASDIQLLPFFLPQLSPPLRQPGICSPETKMTEIKLETQRCSHTQLRETFFPPLSQNWAGRTLCLHLDIAEQKTSKTLGTIYSRKAPFPGSHDCIPR